MCTKISMQTAGYNWRRGGKAANNITVSFLKVYKAVVNIYNLPLYAPPIALLKP